MTRSPPPPLYPVPTEPGPTLDPSMIEDDQELAEVIDQVILLDAAARVRQEHVALHQNALREAAPESWPLFARVEELTSERSSELSLILVRWAFKEGVRCGRGQR